MQFRCKKILPGNRKIKRYFHFILRFLPTKACRKKAFLALERTSKIELVKYSLLFEREVCDLQVAIKKRKLTKRRYHYKTNVNYISRIIGRAEALIKASAFCLDKCTSTNSCRAFGGVPTFSNSYISYSRKKLTNNSKEEMRIFPH